MGSELSCTPKKQGRGGNRGARARVLSTFPPLVSPLFFIFVNFSPAVCYLNAWNRLERTLVTRLVCAELACSGSSILRKRKHEKKNKKRSPFPRSRAHTFVCLSLSRHPYYPREDKEDREGILHAHPIPQVISLELFLRPQIPRGIRQQPITWRECVPRG